MIKVLTAFTEEIDEVDGALAELLEQLDLDHRLLANSLGIIHCYSDFIDSGVIKALGRKLPFDTVGCTTMSLSSPGFMSQIGLTLTVLTSDTVRFVSGVSQPVTDNAAGPVAELYERLISGLPQKPALLMPFLPFLLTVGGNEFIEKLNSLAGNIPAFGTIAISNEQDYTRIYTFYNGESYPASLVLAALIGDVSPVFLSVSVTDENILKQKAIITQVNRNVIETINNIPAVKYFESIGIAKGGDAAGFSSMPAIIYLKDGSVLTRAIIGSTPDGGMILAGTVPANSSFDLATMGQEDVVNSSAAKVTEALAVANGRGMLIYSCAGRNWALGMQVMAEHEKVRECIGNAVPYHFAYSGGEIFPADLGGGKVVNHLQNVSLIICIL
ncbi:MAG: FIST C-terminal domain-containing protein [Treponema sp.]|jgi:hypothetical protein|nr:FIST C-terminal domain-containing protein [Treponema sp.]